MAKAQRNNARIVQPALSEADVERVADALERRMTKYFRPYSVSAMPEVSPRHIDRADLITPQQAAYLYGKSDQTIYRWINQFDISECIAGTEFVSCRKMDAHLARHRDGRDNP